MRSVVTDGVTWSVSWSVGLSVIIVSPAKVAESIKMLLGIWTQVGPRNHVLDGGQISTCEGAILRGKYGQPRTYPVLDLLKATQQGTEPI